MARCKSLIADDGSVNGLYGSVGHSGCHEVSMGNSIFFGGGNSILKRHGAEN